MESTPAHSTHTARLSTADNASFAAFNGVRCVWARQRYYAHSERQTPQPLSIDGVRRTAKQEPRPVVRNAGTKPMFEGARRTVPLLPPKHERGAWHSIEGILFPTVRSA